MKIAFLGHKRIPSRAGGIEIVVNELAVRMAKMGHDVYVYNRNRGEEKLKEYENIHIIEIPTFKNEKLYAIVYAVLATLHTLFRRYDVVHYHAEGPCSMLFLAKLFRKKTVATIHGLDWQRSKWGGFATKYLLFGEKMAAKYADELIVLSEPMREYFQKTYGRDTLLIPNGINPVEAVEPEILREMGLEKREYFLFLARLTPEKGLDYLIDAFKQLDTDKKLVIAGGLEPSTPYIEQIRKKVDDDDRIRLVGFVQGKKLEELFSNCFVYVLPSNVEGMPISLLEAVSYRARVLISDIPESTQVVEDYGHTFKTNDTESLLSQLREITANEALYDCDFKKDMTKQAVDAQIDALLKKHDWDEITAQTLEVYAQAMR